MNPTVRSPLPLAPGLTLRSIERRTLLAKRMNARVKPAYDAPPERTARERAHAKAETRRNATDIPTERRAFFHGLSALVALAAAACADRPFFNSAVRALAARRLNMDGPISVGVVLALGMSIFETLHQSTHVYFDMPSASTTPTLIGP